MEFITGGDLFDFITNNNYLSEIQSCKFFRQLISVIEYLNELGISHRDLKPENILLDRSHQNIKLIDFGLSNYYNDNKLLKSSCGSPCYASPEMLSGKPYLGITTDLWSAGIVLYSMLVGSLPFDDQELYELYKQIKLGKFYLPSTLALEAIDLLKRVLNVDPIKRIDLEGIKNHKWFQLDGYPLYKGINLEKEKLKYNIDTINYVINNFFDKENDLGYIPKNEFIDMVKYYSCNKYTATYYLTKKYILKINDKDLMFKKMDYEKKENYDTDKANENSNIKLDKKKYKKLINDIEIKSEKKSRIDNNYIIKNDINIEIKREENKKVHHNYDSNKEKKINIDLENKEIIYTNIDSNNKQANTLNDDIFKNNSQKKAKIDLGKIVNKNDENIPKRNYKKNELYLNNIKNTNLKTHYRNSIEIKQKKFTKNFLLKGENKTKDNFISNVNNNNPNNCYIIKTWGNNSINHISKTNKITFVNTGNDSSNKKINNNQNYNNYLYHNYNSNYNNHNYVKNKNENSLSVNSYKNNKNQNQTSKKPKNKDKNIKNIIINSNNNNNNNSNSINNKNNSYNKNNNISNNNNNISNDLIEDEENNIINNSIFSNLTNKNNLDDLDQNKNNL
jgi:5'-AMP-activated protein kinase catalytic alpha subunit